MSGPTINTAAHLTTHAILTTADGKQIDLGILDKRLGIKIDFFGKMIDLTFPWTPRLWVYKYIKYPRRIKQLKSTRLKKDRIAS